ncbi:SpoIVB peptidase S55 domain-containing protein [Oleiharenicola lentus]|uniref:SpoIVB peptidase S55 domain-containing protein n=1 Tax=Oleiharenicola lentus TaxID=2508720 RepID=UPI003F67FD3E
MPRRSLSFLWIILISATLSLSAQPVDAPLFPLNDLKRGMKGEVWTVFKGSQSEPFGVEVTGVLRNALGPGKNMILCELTDPRVQGMGAVAGMSGSPLYIDGKLVGVLSYQIQRFETTRYAGFTPISDMLEISTLPTDQYTDGLKATPLPLKSDSAPRSEINLRERDILPLTPAFSVGGLAPNVAALLSSQFEALGLSVNALGGSFSHADTAASSVDTVPTPKELRPGDVVAVALATGDISLAGTGTVSHVDGKRILAFGHPMMSLGATELPMAAAEIVTILPSQLNSIKVSNVGALIGAFSQDRLSGIYGELGKTAPMVPVEVSFPARMNRKSLQFEVVRHEQLLASIAATGLAQAVMGSNESGLARGFKVTTTVTFPGSEPVELNQIYPGPQGFQQGLNDFVSTLSLWIFNPYERVFPEKISFSLENTPEIPQGVVQLMQLSRANAAPGERVDLTVGWRGFQREAATEIVGLDVPRAWAGKELEVVLTTGPALDELTGRPRAVPVAQMRSFEEYISALREFRETDGLYLAVIEKTRIMTDQRASTPEMPGSLERIARGADEARFQRKESYRPLWEQRILPGRLFNIMVRRPLAITD